MLLLKWFFRKGKIITSTVESWLIYASIGLGFSAVGWTLSFYLLMDLPYDLLVLGLVFALTLIMYNRDRLTDYSQPDDRANMGQRSEWIFQHLFQIKVLIIAATVLSVIVVLIRPVALIPILGGLGFSLCYSMKVLPRGRSFKQLPGLKVPYVASLWVVLTVAIPLAVAGGLWNSRAALVATACFCYYAALVNLNDLRDVEGDRLVGTFTLPVLLGKRPARLVSLLLAVLGGGIAAWLGSLGFSIVGVYEAILVISYRHDLDQVLSWFIQLAGVFACLAVLSLSTRF